MGILKFIVGGIPVETDDADLAANLIQKFNHGSLSSMGRHKILIRPRVDEDVVKLAHTFLSALSGSGDRGIESDAIAGVLGAAPKGIGNRLKPVRPLLKALGFEEGTVYVRTKVPGKGRFWKTRSRYSDAY